MFRFREGRKEGLWAGRKKGREGRRKGSEGTGSINGRMNGWKKGKKEGRKVHSPHRCGVSESERRFGGKDVVFLSRSGSRCSVSKSTQYFQRVLLRSDLL